MSGKKRVKTVTAEIAEAGSFALSSVDPLMEQVREFEEKILSTAKGMRRDMDAMFRITKWSNDYKRLHRELRTIVFDE